MSDCTIEIINMEFVLDNVVSDQTVIKQVTLENKDLTIWKHLFNIVNR